MDISSVRSDVETVAGIAGVLANLDEREPIDGADVRAVGMALKEAIARLRLLVSELDREWSGQ